MGLIDEQLKVDGAYHVDSDMIGEIVTYKPQSGGSRAVNAYVERDVTREVMPGSDVPTPYIMVTIRNDATYGTATVVVQGDVIAVAAKVGGTAADFTIRQILPGSDSGMWRLLLT